MISIRSQALCCALKYSWAGHEDRGNTVPCELLVVKLGDGH